MKELREQVNQQQPNLQENAKQPVILINEIGIQVPAFVRAGRLVVGRSCLHFEKLGIIDLSGMPTLALEYFRLTRNDKLVDGGYDTVSKEQGRAWVDAHKAGLE